MSGVRSGCPGDGLSGGASGALDGAGAPPLRGTSPELSRRVTWGPRAAARPRGGTEGIFLSVSVFSWQRR